MSWWPLQWDWGRGNEKRCLRRENRWDLCRRGERVMCWKNLSWRLRNLNFWLSILRERGHHFLVQGIAEEQFGVQEEINSVFLNWRGLWAMRVKVRSRQLAMCVWSSLERPVLMTHLQFSRVAITGSEAHGHDWGGLRGAQRVRRGYTESSGSAAI